VIPVRRQRFLFVLVTCGLLSACTAVGGSGDIVSEPRELGSFSRVAASEGVHVRLVIDPTAEPGVTVRYDDNVLDNVITRLDGGTLVVRLDGAITLGGGADRHVEIAVAQLTGIAADSGAIVSGSGTATGLEVIGSGGASVDLSGLDAGTLDIEVSGGANATLRAADAVSGEASGGARVTILGDPARVEVSTSGGASLSRG
jgi:hypothetical protein